MTKFLYLIHSFLHLNNYLSVLVVQYGFWVYVLIFAIIFCETGIVIAAILPGDSLLFAAGAVAAGGGLNVYYLMFLVIVAAFLGNTTNYWVGNQLGHLLFRKENSILFRKSYLKKTHVFFEKYGAKTILIACFIPIIRTFAAFVAGMGDMQHRKFLLYNFLGACCWVILVVYGSYLFGNIPIVKRNFSFVILAIIVISILPPVIEFMRGRISET